MPITDVTEATDLDAAFERLLQAASLAESVAQLRRIFVERLDFSPAAPAAQVSLHRETELPATAHLIAERQGIQVVYVPVDQPRILARTRAAARKVVAEKIAETLLVFSNRDRSEWQLVYPRQQGGRSVLRRMTIHRGRPRRTVVQQISNLYFDARRTDIRSALERGYDVEAVTEAFFGKYREVFDAVEEMIRFPASVSAERRRLFTQRLFNRLMFLYFLQQKGWLRFQGDTDYLRRLRRAAAESDENFYEQRLWHAFFNGLGVMGDDPKNHDITFYRGRRGDVPFLNGGLFEQEDMDSLGSGVRIPDAAFDLILRELFDRFNFTVDESTAYDVEVAVDPEMLGKIFEELITERHEVGAYYTPRAVVAFMCREALKGYLRREVPALTDEAVRRFVDERDVSGVGVNHGLPVARALERVTVVDPACGSGAYLLGMLQELVDLQDLLFHANLVRDAKSLYELKLRIIERNVYGVDIDRFGVNIARLRLWLSLVVDDTRNPLDDSTIDVSLPNLDFKIAQGDSLTAPSPGAVPDLFRHSLVQHADALDGLQAEFMRTTNRTRKEELLAQINASLEAIRETYHDAPAPAGSFDWRVEIARIFASPAAGASSGGKAAPGGFDIVLANPPYVRADAQFRHLTDEIERQTDIARWATYRRTLRESGIYRTLYEKWDLYIPFLERAFQLLSRDGHMVFIISDAYNTAKYTLRSHEFFLENARVERIDFCSDIPLFKASVRNTIVHFAKSSPPPDHRPVRIRRWGERPDDFDQAPEPLPTAPQSVTRASVFRAGGEGPATTARRSACLADLCYISKGMVIHADDRQARGLFTAEDVVSPIRDATHPKPYVEGKDIERWSVRCIRYLEYGTQRAPALFSRPTFPELHDAPEKLLAFRMCGETPAVIYDDRQLYSNHTAIVFVPWHFLEGVINRSISKTAKYLSQGPHGDREEREHLSREFVPKYLLAVMHSSFARGFVNQRRRGGLDIYPDDWKPLPIPQATPHEQAAIVAKVHEILGLYEEHGYPLPAFKAEELARLEAEIDVMVQELYDG
jgi:type I restriction-modification system DNA methylase subunit